MAKATAATNWILHKQIMALASEADTGWRWLPEIWAVLVPQSSDDSVKAVAQVPVDPADFEEAIENESNDWSGWHYTVYWRNRDSTSEAMADFATTDEGLRAALRMWAGMWALLAMADGRNSAKKLAELALGDDSEDA